MNVLKERERRGHAYSGVSVVRNISTTASLSGVRSWAPTFFGQSPSRRPYSDGPDGLSYEQLKTEECAETRPTDPQELLSPRLP